MGDLTGGYIGSMHHAWAERSNGMAEGFVTGKNVGFDNGYDEGLDDGRAQGFRNGRAQGWWCQPILGSMRNSRKTFR